MDENTMSVLQIRVRSWDEDRKDWLEVGRRLDRDEEGPFGQSYSFSSIERLLDMLAPNRWALLEALLGEEPMSLRALARKVGRDVKGVHSDVRRLTGCGLLEKTEDSKLRLFADNVTEIHVDFTVKGDADVRAA